MFEFFGRKSKAAWVKAVFSDPVPAADSVSEERLRKSTQRILEERRQIIEDSVRIIQQTRNEDTRRGRIELCRKHYEKVKELERFADSEQQKMIRECYEMLKEVNLP